MSGYFYILLLTSVCGALCGTLAWGGFEKYIKYVASLICVLLIILPLRRIRFDENQFDDLISIPETEYDNLLYSASEKITQENAENYIKEILLTNFGIKNSIVNINIDWAREDPLITEIKVFLPETETETAKNAKDYLERILGNEVTVIETENRY